MDSTLPCFKFSFFFFILFVFMPHDPFVKVAAADRVNVDECADGGSDWKGRKRLTDGSKTVLKSGDLLQMVGT